MNGNGSGPALPVAAGDRWQPLRAGLVDLFLYDHEEFWFRDGHLLLRGNNGTGKSKVLALLLPFLLDGDLDPRRVEPDGDPRKRMEWNLLMGGSRSDRLGYTWLEFGRDGEYLTIGCGLRAVAGRAQLDRWFFTTDRRMGRELFLVSPGGVARNRQRLSEALGERGAVYETAKAYRRALDERLFGLGEDRYAALVDLLIQLRQPQLSKRPDETTLNAALTRALPPLDPAVLADIAESFRGLESERDELAALADAREAAQRFLDHYRRYAGIASRRKAEATRKAQSRYETTGRRLTEARRALDEAEAAEAALAARLSELEIEVDAARAAEQTLRDSPEMRKLDNLERARTDAERAARNADRADNDLAAARVRHDLARSGAERAGAAREHSGQAVQDAATAALLAARSVGLGPAHDAAVAPLQLGAAVEREPADASGDTVPSAEAVGDGEAQALAELEGPGRWPPAELPSRLAAARDATQELADRRSRAVDHVLGLAAEVEAAHVALAEQRRRRDETASERDAAVERVTDALRRAEHESAVLVAAAAEFLGSTVELRVPDRDALLGALGAWLSAPEGDNPLTVAVAAAGRVVTEALASAGERIARAFADLETERAELEDERSRLEAGEDATPPRPHTRTEGVRDGRPGAPLWQLVDFRDELGASQRAGLEAALEGSGLLDAWLTPDGALLDPGTLDVVLTTGPPAPRHLGQALRPAVDRGDPAAAQLADTMIEGVLAGIGLGAATADSWVEPTGRWRLGVTEGAWAKPAAAYVGRGAREAARRSRLAKLASQLAALAAHTNELEVQRKTLDGRRVALDAEAARAPRDSAVRAATVLVEASQAERLRLDTRLTASQERAERAERAWDQTVAERSEAAADLGVPQEVTDLERLRSDLGGYRTSCAALWPVVRGHGADVDVLRDAVRATTASLGALESWTERAGEARREARLAEAHRHTLAATVDAAVEEVQRRLIETKDLLKRLTAEVKRRGEERLTARDALGSARALAKELAGQLQRDAAERADATGGFQRFARTGLLSEALPDLELPALDAPWAPDPTVRLTRRVETELAVVDMDETAWERNQRAMAGHLADLTDAMSRHGHTAVGEHTDDGVVVHVVFQGRPAAPSELARRLAGEVAEREWVLEAREREILENHLVNEVASYLSDLLADADEQVRAMNAELEERPTSTGMRLRFVWEASPEAPAGLAEARRRLLRQTSDAWSGEDRKAVETFLWEQIKAVRAADEGGTWSEHLTLALDYRAWHRFRVQRWQDGQWRSATGPASGGERVLAATVPLFAAASAHYRSAANPHAPRLVLLDEAFAGVDDDSRAKCMGLLATFDLDFIMTSEREWGCYPELPGLAIAQLARLPGIEAIHVSRWEWDGRARVRADVTLPPMAEPDGVVAEPDAPSLW